MGLLDNLMNTVNQGIGKAMEKVNAAAQEANAKAEAEGKPLTEEEKEKQAQALDALKGLGGMFSGAVEMAKKEMQAEVEAKAAAEAAIFENWEQNFPYYPKWDVGGSDFELEEMDGDHILPWSKGGKTVLENLQMLCRRDNALKSDKW